MNDERLHNGEREDAIELADALFPAEAADERAAVAAESAGDEAAALRAVMATLQSADGATTGRDFTAGVMARVDAEATTVARPVSRSTRQWWRRLTVPASLAAGTALVFALLWSGGVGDDRGGRGGAGGVVWADVVRAMDRVPQFHMTAFVDDPRSADEQTKLMRIDLFYRQPDRWRAHGMGYVQFSDGKASRVYGAKERRLLEKGDRKPDIIREEFIQRFHGDGMLAAILWTVFRGQPPAGEPVKSDEVSEAAGIEVFDYANQATQRWTRIWVLRESKLPLRMNVFYPGSDEFVMVNFDYSDPQGDAFFDVAAFEAGLKTLDGNDPHRVYSIGSRPVSGTATTKPRGSTQIHEVQGGYKAPQVKRVLSNEAGDVAVVATNPDNRTPSGHRPFEAGFEDVRDSWGNVYIAVGGFSPVGGDQRRYFMPLPPFKRGDGPRTLTMRYVLSESYTQSVVLADYEQDVAPPGAGGEQEDWGKGLEADKASSLKQHIAQNGTLAEKLSEIDRRLAREPRDLATLGWKVALLREHGREDAAWALFERDIRDRLLVDARSVQGQYVLMGQYLLRLAATGRMGEVASYRDRIQKLIDEAAASKDPEAKRAAESLNRRDHNPLQQAMRLPETLAAVRGDAPKVERVVRSRDGFVFIDLAIPTPPESWDKHATGWDGSAPLGWYWQPTWQPGAGQAARMVDLDKNELWFVVKTDVPEITLAATVTLVRDNYGHSARPNHITHDWSTTVAVPEATVEKMADWWATESAGRKGAQWYAALAPTTAPARAPAEQWLGDGLRLQKAGAHEKAIELLAKALDAPAEQWPEWYRDPRMDADALPDQRRWLRQSIVESLAALGRFDDARAQAAALWATLPAATGPTARRRTSCSGG